MSDAPGDDGLLPSVVYTFFGYSQTARFDGVVYRSVSGPLAVGKARWQPMTRAADFFEGGHLSEYVTRALVEMRAIMRDVDERPGPFASILMRPTYDSRVPFHYKPRETNLDRVIALEYGEVDAWDIASELDGRATFPLPEVDAFENLPDDERGADVLPLETVVAMLRERLAPFFEGVAALHAAGFRRLYVPGIGPPNLNRPAHFASVRLRCKLYVLANREIARFCAGGAARFVPIWDHVATGGVRDVRYGRDDLHLNSESAIFTMRAIAEDLARG